MVANVHSPDFRQSQLQFLNPPTCLRSEALEFYLGHKRLADTSTPYSASWPLCFLIAHVYCAESPSPTILPAFLLRYKPRRSGTSLDSPAQLFFQPLCECHGRPDELCAGKCNDTTSFATAHECVTEFATTEQHLFTAIHIRSDGPSILLCPGSCTRRST